MDNDCPWDNFEIATPKMAEKFMNNLVASFKNGDDINWLRKFK
jgi:hypothetical protein